MSSAPKFCSSRLTGSAKNDFVCDSVSLFSGSFEISFAQYICPERMTSPMTPFRIECFFPMGQKGFSTPA